MAVETRPPSFLLLLLAPLAACAPSTVQRPAAPAAAATAPPAASAGTAPPARHRAVHIDTLAPDKVAQFVDARRAWVEELRRNDATDGRGVFLEVPSAHRFVTVRAFASYSSFDTRRAIIEASLSRVLKEARDRYDRLSDTSLVFPHTSEIWDVDDDLSYVPRTGALDESSAACGTLIIEDVRPDPASSERYDAARGEINKALAQVGYALTRLSFETTYGAGHLWTLLLAPSREALDGAPPEVEAIAGVLGAGRAHDLEGEIDASVEKREVQPFVVRHDLSWRPVP
jgi:hypothetical protein